MIDDFESHERERLATMRAQFWTVVAVAAIVGIGTYVLLRCS